MTKTDIAVCLLIGLLLGLLFSVTTKHRPKPVEATIPPEVPCIYYRDSPKRNIPTRCLSPEGDFRAE